MVMAKDFAKSDYIGAHHTRVILCSVHKPFLTTKVIKGSHSASASRTVILTLERSADVDLSASDVLHKELVRADSSDVSSFRKVLGTTKVLVYDSISVESSMLLAWTNAVLHRAGNHEWIMLLSEYIFTTTLSSQFLINPKPCPNARTWRHDLLRMVPID